MVFFQLDDSVVELNNVRTDFRELEKKQNKFDQRLEEEKVKVYKAEEERDAARRDIRDRETKVFHFFKIIISSKKRDIT